MEKERSDLLFVSGIFLLLFLLILPRTSVGQSVYPVYGKIYDEQGEALPGAIIELHELNKAAVSDSAGNYTIKNLKPGTYHLHVTFIGFEAVDRTVKLLHSGKKVDFQLHESSVELREVLVEANPFKSGPLEQSLTIETVGRDFLDRNHGNSFVGALEKIPGISSINTGVGISKPVIRGLSFNRVIVSDRGVKQEGQQWGSDHGLEIDQFDPQRIEIIKGPASLLYGSDGMGGVINIRPPGLPKEGEIKGELSGIYRSNNNFWGSSAYLSGNQEGFIYGGRFSVIDFADYHVPAESAVYNTFTIPVANGQLKNTAGQERNFSLTGGVSKDWGYSTITLSSFNQKAGIYPGAIALPGEYSVVPDGDARNIDLPRQVIQHLKVISNTNIRMGDHWLEADLGVQHNNRREESFPHAHGQQQQEGNLALQLKLLTLSASVRYHQNFSERFSSIWGLQGQYQENSRDGFEFLLPDLQTAGIGFYNYTEAGLGSKATINGGLRFDYGEVNAKGYRHSASWVKVYGTRDVDEIIRSTNFSRDFSNISAALGISFYPTHHFNAKLNLGKSFKIPSYAELASNGIHHGTFRHETGDSTLVSEKGYQADLNLTWHTNDFHFSVTPFVYYFQDFIYLSPTVSFTSTDARGIRYSLPEGNQVYRYSQHDALFMGAEASAEYHIFKNLHLLASFEWVRNKNLDTSLPLPFTPPLSVLGEAEYTLPWKTSVVKKAWLGIQSRYAAGQERVDRNELTTPAYLIFKFTAGTELKVGSQRPELSLQVQNLGNTKYLNHLSRYRLLNLPEQGRNVSLLLKLPLEIKSKN